MNIKIILTIIIATLLTSCTSKESNKKQLDKTNEVIQLEKDWLKAYEERDITQMNIIVDDDFEITYPNGYKQKKKDILEYLKSDDVSCKNMKLYTTETYAKDYGNVVILRGVVTTECNSGKDKFSQRRRYTDTYLFKDGKWQVIASHLSSL